MLAEALRASTVDKTQRLAWRPFLRLPHFGGRTVFVHELRQEPGVALAARVMAIAKHKSGLLWPQVRPFFVVGSAVDAWIRFPEPWEAQVELRMRLDDWELYGTPDWVFHGAGGVPPLVVEVKYTWDPWREKPLPQDVLQVNAYRHMLEAARGVPYLPFLLYVSSRGILAYDDCYLDSDLLVEQIRRWIREFERVDLVKAIGEARTWFRKDYQGLAGYSDHLDAVLRFLWEAERDPALLQITPEEEDHAHP